MKHFDANNILSDAQHGFALSPVVLLTGLELMLTLLLPALHFGFGFSRTT
jgi:hypothetical protein